MTTAKLHVRQAIKPLVGSIAALLLGTAISHAVGVVAGTTSNWLGMPVDGNWNNSANWDNSIVPNSNTAVAAFGNSKFTTIGLPLFSNTAVDRIVVNSGGSAFTFVVKTATVNFDGAGFVNNSGKTQNLIVGTFGQVNFNNSASAGNNTVITVRGTDGAEGGGILRFQGNSNGGQATLIALGGVLGGNPSSSTLTGGGAIVFAQNSQGGQAAVQVFGNGYLDVSQHNSGTVTIGSLAGNGIVFLGANNLAVGANNQNSSFSGSIQDGGEGLIFNTFPFSPLVGGSLTKVGTGTLFLNGSNSYTGNTIIDGGTLIVNGSIASPYTFVNPGGTLGGTGFIGGSVINNGIVAPGDAPGTLTIHGNYTQSSNAGLFIQIASPASYDRLAVGGSANINGTLIVEAIDPSKLKKGQTFEFLTAGEGVSGRFSHLEVVDSGTLIRFKLQYGSDEVSVKTVLAPFSSVSGLTPNQDSVANALDHIANDKGASKLINFLATQPIGNLVNDFDKLSAEGFTSIFTIGTSFDNVQSQTIQSYLDSLRSGTGFSAGGLALNGFSVNYAGPIQFRTGVAGPNGDDGKESKEVQQVAPAENRWGAFLTGTGQWVGVSDDFNARGYDVATGGFTLGVDYKVNSHFAVGVMAGYVGTGVDLSDGGRVFVNGGKLGLYATAFQNRQPAAPTGLTKDSSKDSSKEAPLPPQVVDPGWYADLAVVGGYSSYDVRRAGLEGTARGDTDGGDLNVLVGAGYDFKRGNFTFGPTASFNYTYVGVGSFTESGSLAPLHIDSQGQDSIRTAFGMKASYDWKIGALAIKPELRAAWQHEYGNTAYALNSSFADAEAGNFTVWGPRIGRDSFLLGAGFAVQLSERCSTYFYYDGELGRTRYDSHAVTGGVRLAF